MPVNVFYIYPRKPIILWKEMSEDFSALKQKKVKGLLKGHARRTSGSYSKTSNSSEVLIKTFKMK